MLVETLSREVAENNRAEIEDYSNPNFQAGLTAAIQSTMRPRVIGDRHIRTIAHEAIKLAQEGQRQLAIETFKVVGIALNNPLGVSDKE